MQPVFVADTHAILWFASSDSRLGKTAAATFQKAGEGKSRILVPAIVLLECLYALRKAKAEERFEALIDGIERHPHFRVVAFDVAVARECGRMKTPDESHDRVIGATARLHGAKVLTKDPEIRAAHDVVW